MKLYHPGEIGKSQWILKATHTLFAASLQLSNHNQTGLQWVCFIICHTPMVSPFLLLLLLLFFCSFSFFILISIVGVW